MAAINSGLTGDYILMNDLDSTTVGYDTYASSSSNSGDGWDMLAQSNYFSGIFDGNWYAISDVYMTATGGDDYGFFETIGDGCIIKNLSFTNCSMIFSGEYEIIGLSLLIGRSLDYTYISNTFVSGTITSTDGFIDYSGGLIGYYSGGDITNCYCDVDMNISVGAASGLVGCNNGTVTNCYSIGSVNLVNSYSGGLIGKNNDTVSNSYYDSETSGQSDTGKGDPKTTSQMNDIDTFSSWDIIDISDKSDGNANHSYIWNIVDNYTYPFLSYEYSESSQQISILGINQITGVQSITI